MKILGIDPGLNRTGYGVVAAEGDRLRCVDFGVIAVPAGELPLRLGFIFERLAGVIRDAQPDRACIEEVFVNVNPKTTLLLGQARGAAICAAVAAGLALREHAALQVKKSVVGTGRAGKEQVQAMVQRLLGLAAPPPADAADALACAICDAHVDRMTRLTGTAWAGASGRARRSRASWRARGVPGGGAG
ncbi:MAG TPA: crossover junction endodeoxyribonuclease RuvC [Burkholderiaceae bacterium]|nr:crossover junction endodeoxyribonuclease RuvC [Burkholderiaceae bacterium]